MTVVAVCQVRLAVGDLTGNRQAGAAAVAEAAAAGASVIVLPELADSGYLFTGAPEARRLAAPVAGNPTVALWQELAARHAAVIAGGFCELGPDGRLYNSAALVDATVTPRSPPGS